MKAEGVAHGGLGHGMSRSQFGGIIAILFFAAILVVIPSYVPRPAFIPGFAPPPDMWPRTVSWVGLLLGVLCGGPGVDEVARRV